MKEFRKILESISRRWSLSQVFDDFLVMAVCVFARGTMEDVYLERVKRYDADEAQLFGDALGAMFRAYEEGSCSGGSWTDIVGQYFEEVNSSATASASGQFFTPVTLCDMMARILDDGRVPEIVNDPTCGSARNLVAHARMDPDNRLKTTYIGQDLDSRCVMMSVINYVMYGMKGYVIHCDTLKMEFFGGYRIYLPETGLMVRRISAESAKHLMTTARKPDRMVEKPAEPVQEIPEPAAKQGQPEIFWP